MGLSIYTTLCIGTEFLGRDLVAFLRECGVADAETWGRTVFPDDIPHSVQRLGEDVSAAFDSVMNGFKFEYAGHRGRADWDWSDATMVVYRDTMKDVTFSVDEFGSPILKDAPEWYFVIPDALREALKLTEPRFRAQHIKSCSDCGGVVCDWVW